MCKRYQRPPSQKKYLFANLMNLTSERNKRLNFYADPILIKINCNQRLQLNKMTYFDDLIIHFDRVYDINYGEKIRFVIDANVCSSYIILPAEINLYFSYKSLLYLFSKYFLLSCPSVSLIPLLPIPIVSVSNKIVVTVVR